MFVFIWSETCRRLAEDRQWPTHNYLTNQTTNSCEQNASWRANSFPSSQETVCPIFYKTRRFITVFTRASHMSLYLTSSIIRRSPNRFLQDFFFFIFSNWRTGLPNGIFQVPSPKPCTHLSSPIRATCPVNPILDLNTRTMFGEVNRSWSSSLCSCLQFVAVASLPRIIYRRHNTKVGLGVFVGVMGQVRRS